MNKIYEWIDRVWVWIAEKIFVRFEFDLPKEKLLEKARTGRVLFALTHGGVVEWLILSSWCRSNGLGAILVCNRKRVLLLAKPLHFLQILFAQKKYSDLFLAPSDGPRLIFVSKRERKKPFDPTPVERLLADIYALDSERSAKPWECYPILIFWRKFARSASRNLSEYLFGLSSNPNLIGKIWYLARKRKDSTVRCLAPFPIPPERLGSESSDVMGETEALRAAKLVRRRILVSENQEMRVAIGPRYLSPYSVKETLLRHPDIQKTITEIAEREGVDRKKVMLQAYQYLNEIVANYQYRFIEVMYVGLTWLFTKIFDGVSWKEEEVHAVREIMKTKPVVFVSCHRSHLDYMVIPYVLFIEDMIPPHVAAGVNLSFWPVGHFLRMGGAFFIRRSFRGNALYSLCLRKYIQFLLINRHNLKFFIEGTRSRSGKMLPPAYGILKMVLESSEQQVLDDICLVPVSICYDEILEQGAYTKELTGGEKTKESTSSLLRSRKSIGKNIGKVYLRFGTPVFAKEINRAVKEGADPKLNLQKTAFQLCKSINDVTPITAKALVCCVLLGSRVSALTLDEILRMSSMLARYVEWWGSPLSVTLEDGFRGAAELIVRRLHKSGVLTVTEMVPRSFACDDRKRLILNFYKNNAMHCLVLPSMSLLSFYSVVRRRSSGAESKSLYDEVVSEAIALRNVLKFDFFFSPTQQFVDEIDRNLEFFFGTTLKQSSDVKHVVEAMKEHFGEWGDVSIYLRMLGDLLESYLTLLKYLELIAGESLEKKALIQRVVKWAEEGQSGKMLAFPESNSVQNYSNAIQLLDNLGIIVISDKMISVPSQSEGAATALKTQLVSWLDLMQENPQTLSS